MFKVVTMSDSNYFDAGETFLKTRGRVNADFVLYGPDLIPEQIDILNKNNVEYIKMDVGLYKNRMQFLKFGIVKEQIVADKNKKYKGFTLADFDTFFINDWNHIFDYDFDYGITIRNKMVRKRGLVSYTNGGVVFAKHTAYNLLEFAEKIILAGKNKNLPEYNKVWLTLEVGNPKHKTRYRTELRWWVDQVFLCALALRYFEKYGYRNIGLDPVMFDFNGTNIGLFSCDNYNVVDSLPDIAYKKDIYIKHLKTVGRNFLGVNRTVETL